MRSHFLLLLSFAVFVAVQCCWGVEPVGHTADPNATATPPPLSDPQAGPCETKPSSLAIHITNPKGLYPFEDYVCGSFSQKVTKESDTAVTIHTQVPTAMPKPREPYPIERTPENVAPYLAPTPRIQSKDPGIARVAQEILASTKPKNEVDLVEAVCLWASKNVTWDLPNEVPDAVTCLKRKRGNCIGFSHVAAAILRNLGVPVRTMRAYVAMDCGHMTRHTVIEVYYPQDDLWVAYDPQSGGSMDPHIIYLYTDPDWSVEGQRKTRPFSVDPNTRVALRPR